jgi:hypothetical protein
MVVVLHYRLGKVGNSQWLWVGWVSNQCSDGGSREVAQRGG